MIKSMTGFGRATVSENGRTVILELKAVNHKYLDQNFRMPRVFNYLEHELRKRIADTLSRGHIDIMITYKNTREDAKTVDFDKGLISKYAEFASESSSFVNARSELSILSLMRFPEVITVSDAEEDEDALRTLTFSALDSALASLISMRENEGKHMEFDIQKKLDTLENIRLEIEKYAPTVAENYAARLKERITAALDNVAYDETRLITEIALFTDKASIDEELVRAKTHIVSMREMLNSDVAIGRSLDFLTQEMNREFNTMGSKSNDTELAKAVVLAKTEIEKIREQVQNIE